MAEVALDFLGDLRRTHSCGELRANDVGQTVVLMGRVHRRRDLGGVIFERMMILRCMRGRRKST